MTSNFPSGPDTIVNNVNNNTPELDTHPTVHNQLADAVMAVEHSLLAGGSLSLADHLAAADPHAVYLTQAEGNSLYAILASAVPTGGTTGQVLNKTSNADYATGWITPSAGSSLTPPLYTDNTSLVEQRNASTGQTLRIYKSYIDSINYDRASINYASGNLKIGTEAQGTGTSTVAGLDLMTNGTLRWRIFGSAGHLFAATDASYDIGQAGDNRPRNLYLAGGMDVAGGATMHGNVTITSPATLTLAADPVGNLEAATKQYADTKITQAQGDARYLQSATAATTYLPLAGGTLTGNLLFSTDNTRDIGASGATRPRTLYLGTSMVTPGWTNGTNLLANTDNTYDIGASGANRPRNVYVGGTLNVAGQSTLTGLRNLGTSQLDGGVGIGIGPGSAFGLVIQPQGTLTGASQYGIICNPKFSSASTNVAEAINGSVQTQAAAFTIAGARALHADTPSLGAGSAITTIAGLLVENQGGAGRVNAYGVFINAQSGASTTNTGLYNAGTTQFDGAVGIGVSPQGNTKLFVRGVDATSSNAALVAQDSGGNNLFLVRNDGYTIIASATALLSFFGGASFAAKQTVTGSRGGNAALASLCTALAAYGLITNSTTA